MKSDWPGRLRSGVQGEWSDTWSISASYWMQILDTLEQWVLCKSNFELRNMVLGNKPAYQSHPSSQPPKAPPCCSCKTKITLWPNYPCTRFTSQIWCTRYTRYTRYTSQIRFTGTPGSPGTQVHHVHYSGSPAPDGWTALVLGGADRHLLRCQAERFNLIFIFKKAS